MHRDTFAVTVFTSLLSMHSAHASDAVAQAIGEAYDLNSAKHLYSETHCASGDALTREVIYRNADDELIAHKILNYGTGAMTPSYVQHNFQAGESIAVALRQHDLTMAVSTQADSGSGKTVTIRLDANLPLVIDAGFDAFVRGNWDSLVLGQHKRFQFPLAARETLVDLHIERSSCSYETATDQCFSLELNNWLLNKLATPIELGYDAQLQRLTRFRGVSNIGDGDGGGQLVDIRYRYQNVASAACDVTKLSRAEHTADLEHSALGDEG